MSEPLCLFIEPTSSDFAAGYRNAAEAYNQIPYAERPLGFGLLADMQQALRDDSTGVFYIPQGCRALAVSPRGETRAYWLTPQGAWRLANSMILVSSQYRGLTVAEMTPRSGAVQDQHICQLAAPDLLPWAGVVVVDELPELLS